MESAEGVPVCLPEWSVGHRKFRYLFLRSPDSIKVCKEIQTEENLPPLFLGADIVAKTGIRVENHPRIHAKFAKKGLATKLSFTSAIRFEGLKVPSVVNSLWFYSIQGLFRVAFEMYSKEQQLEVLDILKDLWKGRINDPLLNQTYNIKFLQNISEQSENCLMETGSHQDFASPSEFQATYSECELHSINRNRTTASSLDCGISTRVVCEGDHSYCVQESEPCPNNSARLEATGYDSLSARLQLASQAIRNLPAQIQEQGKAIALLTDFLELLLSETVSVQRLVDTVQEFLSQVQDLVVKTEIIELGADSIYGSHMLYAVSNWLGHQFYAANASISSQVEDFKTTHISRITDLPPAEELVDQLFPEAMKVLLLNWMGLDDNSAMWKRQSEYPILLLILEFANHNLITGVAHVLYSSLICK
eukprot:gi/632968214/ref/XP_007900404.1/ PREDICTED: uncharacterized protein LOC103184291 [Callorhinchus milii]